MMWILKNLYIFVDIGILLRSREVCNVHSGEKTNFSSVVEKHYEDKGFVTSYPVSKKFILQNFKAFIPCQKI